MRPLLDTFTLDLPLATSVHARTPYAARIYAAIEKVPSEKDAGAPELAIEDISLTVVDDVERLTVKVSPANKSSSVDLITELPARAWPYDAKVERKKDISVFQWQSIRGPRALACVARILF